MRGRGGKKRKGEGKQGEERKMFPINNDKKKIHILYHSNSLDKVEDQSSSPKHEIQEF